MELLKLQSAILLIYRKGGKTKTYQILDKRQ
jgi:hypothetical protein